VRTVAVRIRGAPTTRAPRVLPGFALGDEGSLLPTTRRLLVTWLLVTRRAHRAIHRKRRITPRTTPRNCSRDVKMGSMLEFAGCNRIMPFRSR
jgi:hypothetical protein